MRWYHVSETDLDGVEVQPAVPSNWMVRKGYENGQIKRICCAPTIDQCLMAMGKKLSGKTLYVHEPAQEDFVMMSTEKIMQNGYVADAHLTEERWILQPVFMKKVMTIHVSHVYFEPFLYTYGEKNEREAELYRWSWVCQEAVKRKNPGKGNKPDEGVSDHASLPVWK